MMKKIYVDVFVSLLLHITKAPITASSENVPDSHFSANRPKYYHLFKQNVFQSAHIRKKYTFL